MSTHTPGPWIAHCMTLAEAKEDGSFEWMTMGDDAFAKPPDFRVGEVWKLTNSGGTTGLPGSIETTEANAHLIAAAPDLLAACQAFVAADEGPIYTERERAAINLMRAAIAKAEAKGQAA